MILALLAAASALASCGGGGNGIIYTGPNCTGCEFFFATTTSGQIVSAQWTGQNAASAGFTSVKLTPGPADSHGMAASFAVPTYVYVSDPVANAVRVYSVSRADGSISPAPFGPYPLTGATGTPMQMVTYRLGSTYLYVASTGGMISAFTVNDDGTLTPVTGSPFAAGAGASNLCLAYRNNSIFLYADGGGGSAGISAFALNTATGVLTPITGSPFPAPAAPAGLLCGQNALYAALPSAGAVAEYAIAANGALSALPGSPVAAGAGVTSLAFADNFVYAENTSSATVSGYSADKTTGALSPVPGSPFAAPGAAGPLFADSGGLGFNGLLVPQASGFLALLANSATGALTAVPGSPFTLGATPIAAADTFNPQSGP